MKLLITDTHKKIVFHIFLWSIWLYLSLSNIRDEESYDKARLIITLVVLTHIPLFLLNTEWLIPKTLIKKGVLNYLFFLVASLLLFIFFHGLILDWLTDKSNEAHEHRSLKLSKGTIALIIVATISTVYGLLMYVFEQEKRQHEQQKEHLQSELSFLRSQINPHFIFNILNSIVYLIRSKSDAAEPVTLKLSELMRYMLYETENTQIALEKEVYYLENYIELQKVRFEEDVEIIFNTSEKQNSASLGAVVATTQMIEPMLLIPFVENAFKHGVGMVINPIIEIDLKTSPTTLSFSVKNKIAPETAMDKDGGSGIGLKNVQRRLELLYPKTHLLTIKNDNDWFLVTLDLTFN
jgi:two-component system, LytTR family, sensor kinase